MRRVREVLRLGFAGISKHEIARRTGLAASTVRETIERFKATGLDWPLPETVTDNDLEAKLYKNAGTKQGHRRHAEPDWACIHRELRRKHVTLSILWDEYIEQRPDGYRYSRFCELYRAWEGKLSLTMRQAHASGDKLFVDYAGDTAPVVIDRLTGEIREAQIFVAVLGASNFTYAEATWTQGLADWIGGHTRALEAIGGVPRLIVPDNAKTAVIKSCLYDPAVNRTYTEMAAHYDTAILPTRPRKPRDKAKVEAAVLIMERWILGRLRNQRFYSLTALNEAIRGLLVRVNDQRPIRRLGVTRRQLLIELDRPALKPFLVVLWPFAPHLADELWAGLGETGSIASVAWPEASKELLRPAEREVLVRVDGRICQRLKLPSGLEREKLESQALRDPRVQEAIAGRPVARVVAVPDKVVSIVTGVPEPAQPPPPAPAPAPTAAPTPAAGAGPAVRPGT